MDKVDATMATVNEQRELANEIAETISGPMYTEQYDEVGLVLYYVEFPDVLIVYEGGAEGRIGGVGTERAQRAAERSGSRTCAYAPGDESGRCVLYNSIVPGISPRPQKHEHLLQWKTTRKHSSGNCRLP
jgi:hypothetical protein